MTTDEYCAHSLWSNTSGGGQKDLRLGHHKNSLSWDFGPSNQEGWAGVGAKLAAGFSSPVAGGC